MTKLKNKDAQSGISQGEDEELTLIRLLMAYFDERVEGLLLHAGLLSIIPFV